MQSGGEAIVGMQDLCCGRRGARGCQLEPLAAHSSSDSDVRMVGRPGPMTTSAAQQPADGGVKALTAVATGIEGGWYLICRPGGRYFVYRPPRRSREPSDRDRAAGSEPRERVTWAVGVSSAQFTSEAHKMKRGHTLSVVFAPSEHMNRRGGADGRRMEAGED